MNNIKEPCDSDKWDTCRVEKMGCDGCHYTDLNLTPFELDKYKVYYKQLNKLNNLYLNKNHDYGDSVSRTFEEYGLTSFLVRMDDKMNRIKTLNKTNDVRVKGEKLEDTLLDLANYAILAVTEIQHRAKILTAEPEELEKLKDNNTFKQLTIDDIINEKSIKEDLKDVN